MLIIDKIQNAVKHNPDTKVIVSGEKSLTYSELWDQSEKLGLWLEEQLGDNKNPLVVYGHKDPLMLVCFLACARTGRAYCPVDISMPKERIMDIIDKVGNTLVLSTLEDRERIDGDYRVVTMPELHKIGEMKREAELSRDVSVKEEDIFYIIFTSGSTGKPKGVEISHLALSNFTDWSVGFGEDEKELGNGSNKSQRIFLNQAPFSFDLSVMDVYTSLASGATIYCLSKECQKDAKTMIDTIEKGNLNYWVSTPSFADMCLANQEFNENLMPNIKAFLFCGEKLTKSTAKKLMERFPKAKVVNTYGPTESTVAVTEVEITESMIDDEKELPIGIAKPGTTLKIDPENEEILIYGNTLSKGYYENPEKTEEVFKKEDDGTRFYRTGDSGFFVDGVLYYKGRIDFQIKLHGYRMELGDIEANLMELDGISGAAVLPKKNKEGKVRHLVAFVVQENTSGSFDDTKAIKSLLKKKLPEYMIPKKIVFIDGLPITANGKTDRKKLEEKL